MKSLIKSKNCSLNNREKVSLELFEHIKIETNSVCTRHCSFCLFGLINNKVNPKLKLETNVVCRLIDELKDINFSGRIGLFEINEPLTDKRIFSFLSYATNKLPKAWHMLITNGDLLTTNVARRLFEECGLDQLCVSLYDDKTEVKIKYILELLPHLASHIELIDSRSQAKDNRGGNILLETKVRPPLKASCGRVNKMLVVKSDGTVVSCFSDYFKVNNMGNVYSQSLQDIWFGQKFKELRAQLNIGNRQISSLCSQCDYPGSGGFFKVYKK